MTWTNQAGFTTAYGSGNVNSVIWDGFKFVTIEPTNGYPVTSPDGVVWTVDTHFTEVFGSGQSPTAMVVFGGHIAAVGSLGQCVTLA